MQQSQSSQPLGKTSWCILVLSLVIDLNHVRAFPSYNALLGIFAWYCSRSVRDEFSISPSSILNITSCFITLTIFSLILDGTFCFIWGREIIDGDVRSVKFSFAMFILNMLPKTISIFYAVAIQIAVKEGIDNEGDVEISLRSTKNSISVTPKKVRFEDSYDNETSGSRISMASRKSIDNDVYDIDENEKGIHDLSDMERKKSEYISSLFPNSASPIENLSFDGSDEDTTLRNMPLPPFSPGVPGLVSPIARKLKFGAVPPQPPMRR